MNRLLLFALSILAVGLSGPQNAEAPFSIRISAPQTIFKSGSEVLKYRPICFVRSFPPKRPKIRQIGRYLTTSPVQSVHAPTSFTICWSQMHAGITIGR